MALTSDSEEELYTMAQAKEGTQLISEKEKISGKAWGRVGKIFKPSEGYPKSVFFILGNEFCERFSYYGMRTILVIYLTTQIGLSKNTSTAVYHGFIFLCYVSPLLGAMLADGFIGKYRTILYVSIVYAIGNIVVAVTAIPPAEMYGPAIGLILIGLGTGGIKPCVVAFGGDQFSSDQEQQRSSFFSVFYFAINAGSLISTFLTPVLRGDVKCFGKDCFFLAFSVPAILMIVAVVFFFCGRNMYKKSPPTGNIIAKTCKCIAHAIKNKITSKNEIHEHWLDYAEDSYEASFITDVKATLRVLLMFLPLPLFWALFDQQGSRWTLQAAMLDGEIGSYRLKPEQLQAINPVFILVLIPIFESAIYPLLDKCHIPNRPLQRMCAGMILGAVSFVIAGFLQLRIDATLESPLTDGYSEVKFINAAPCYISVDSRFLTFPYNMSLYSDTKEQNIKSGVYSVSVTGMCQSQRRTLVQNITITNQKAYNIIIGYHDNALHLHEFLDIHEKPKKAKARINIINAVVASDVLSFLLKRKKHSYHLNATEFNTTIFELVEPGSYKLSLVDPYNSSRDVSDLKTLELHNGGVYTVVIQKHGSKIMAVVFEDISPNTLSIFLQVPQYIVITMGEVMFSITGLSFAYSQAPATMKSVMQAAWLLTVAIGNLVVVIVAETSLLKQAAEFFLFASLMGLVTLIFGVMACFYTYVNYNGRIDEMELDTEGLVTTGSNGISSDADDVSKTNGSLPEEKS